MNYDFLKISKKFFALGLFMFFPCVLFCVKNVNAYTETKTGEISTSKISGFIPSGTKMNATIKDINKYLAPDQTKIDEATQCENKKAEATSYYNSPEKQKCQGILNYQNQGGWGYFNNLWEWIYQTKPPTDAEIASCKAKEDLVKTYTNYGLYGDEYGNYYGTPSPYYDPNTGQINCAKDMISASALGLGAGDSPYLSKSKIIGLIGSYLENQGGTGGLWGWTDGVENKYCLKAYPTGSGGYYWVHCFNFTAEEGYRISCSQKNTYNYSFDYQTKKLGDLSWGGLSSGEANKCQDIKLAFSSIADFAASLVKNKETGGKIDFFNYGNYAVQHVPPTDILACSDQATCLSQAKEYEIAPGTGNFAKGVLQVPTGFKETAEKSLLSSNNANLACSGGACKTTKVGNYTIKATAPQSIYFGQCREGGNTVNTDGQTIGAIESSINLNVINRAPLVYVSLSGNSANVNEEVTATCDISDPDACVDKITKVKWYCYNDKKEKVNCYFGKDGIWKEGEVSEEIPEDKQSSEYRSIVKFKAGVQGVYALTCEATDNDMTSKATGKGIVPIQIGDCGKDGVCNQNCNPVDPDCGVVSKKFKFCSILFDNGSTNKTICGKSVNSTLSVYKSGTIEDKDVAKYQWNCGNSEGIKEGLNTTQNCSYGEEGDFAPSLKIYYKDGSEPTDCSSENNSVKVTSIAKCSVLARPAGSTEEYKKEIKVGVNQPIEAKIEKECAKEEDKTTWLTDGIKIGTSTDTKASIKYQSGGLGYIKAKIGNTDCEGVNVTVDEKMKWGN